MEMTKSPIYCTFNIETFIGSISFFLVIFHFTYFSELLTSSICTFVTNTWAKAGEWCLSFIRFRALAFPERLSLLQLCNHSLLIIIATDLQWSGMMTCILHINTVKMFWTWLQINNLLKFFEISATQQSSIYGCQLTKAFKLSRSTDFHVGIQNIEWLESLNERWWMVIFLKISMTWPFLLAFWWLYKFRTMSLFDGSLNRTLCYFISASWNLDALKF